jgi:hypothetical protein
MVTFDPLIVVLLYFYGLNKAGNQKTQELRLVNYRWIIFAAQN